MIKAAFFDIDGTLRSFITHTMPRSTVRALDELRKRSIKTVISTGRTTYQLPEEYLHGFDAYITLSGQLCLQGDEVYRSAPIPEDDVRVIVDQARSGLYDVLVMQRERDFCSSQSKRVRAVAEQAGLVYPVDDLARALDEPVYQFCAFIDPGEEHLFLDKTKSVKATRWTNLFCDIVPQEGGKDVGVRATCERLGISPDEAIAFGDGENDLSMLDAVDIGVAMGNAWGELKERADYVTDDVDHDGIWNACKHFGLV